MADMKKRPGKKRKWNRDDTELTILAFPTAVWYILFSFLPMFGIVIAFKKYTINGGFLAQHSNQRLVRAGQLQIPVFVRGYLDDTQKHYSL